jgi:predicted NAD/FAD-dependent oxidoreductase
MSNHRAVVVIGAGISGLLCAYRLKMLGVDVVLFEKSDRVGGVIQSERLEGYLIERGPNSSQGTEELVALVEELGLLDVIKRARGLQEGSDAAPVGRGSRDGGRGGRSNCGGSEGHGGLTSREVWRAVYAPFCEITLPLLLHFATV